MQKGIFQMPLLICSTVAVKTDQISNRRQGRNYSHTAESLSTDTEYF